MNFKKLLLTLSLLALTIIPQNALAYSSKVIPGGQNIGIEVNLKYVSVVGFYKVGSSYIGEDAGLKLGDKIKSINGEGVSSIDAMVSKIRENLSSSIELTIERNGKEKQVELPLIEDENGIIKTGLYVKDKISGIGTLSYIDPETKIFGALGHEILDKNTGKKVEIKDGVIFESDVVSITPSTNGKTGEKNAKFYSDNTYGTINKNEEEGIFGNIKDSEIAGETIEVGNFEDVHLGKAILRTVVENEKIEDFEIEILELNENNQSKNILFEIKDAALLDKTGGVVSGMSGSPIIQDGKLIAACTHVIVNSPEKGFAIAIEKMLEEGEK